ncbi:hypothetical protein V4Y02_23515, partial [Escherichia coli]
QSQPQQWQGAKQLSETLSLNKIQNQAEDVAQWLSAPEFHTCYPSAPSPPKKKEKEKEELECSSVIEPFRVQSLVLQTNIFFLLNIFFLKCDY